MRRFDNIIDAVSLLSYGVVMGLHFYGGLYGYNEKTAFNLLRGFSVVPGRLL